LILAATCCSESGTKVVFAPVENDLPKDGKSFVIF
jgi:hypothetical protein